MSVPAREHFQAGMGPGLTEACCAGSQPALPAQVEEAPDPSGAQLSWVVAQGLAAPVSQAPQAAGVQAGKQVLRGLDRVESTG